jgi:HSP20 family protein
MPSRTNGSGTWSWPTQVFADVAFLQNQLDRLAQEAFGARSQASVMTLPVDVFDKGDEIVVSAFVPGLRAEHLDVQIEDGVVTISGSFPQLYDADDARGYTWFTRELRGGRFQRVFSLPAKVDVEHTTAEIVDGILRLVFPKAAEAKARRIQISEGSHGAETAQIT